VAGALERAVDGRDARIEELRDFAGREVERVAQEQYGALPRRQVLEHRYEGEVEALLLLVARRRRGRGVGDPERLVRVGPIQTD
jgi:hypothetical protein